MPFSSPVVSAITRELDLCALRHQIYAANIANADGQGYHRLEVIRSSQANDVGLAQPALSQVVSTQDAVKLDQEIARLTKNALRYETLLTAYEKTAGIMNMAVKDGRGS